jgi:hypothetical protein
LECVSTFWVSLADQDGLDAASWDAHHDEIAPFLFGHPDDGFVGKIVPFANDVTGNPRLPGTFQTVNGDGCK